MSTILEYIEAPYKSTAHASVISIPPPLAVIGHMDGPAPTRSGVLRTYAEIAKRWADPPPSGNHPPAPCANVNRTLRIPRKLYVVGKIGHDNGRLRKCWGKLYGASRGSPGERGEQGEPAANWNTGKWDYETGPRSW